MTSSESSTVRSFAGVALDRPRIMGIVNVTPDSFSDGGDRFDHGRAIEAGIGMRDEGADFVDVGGESTRPGAGEVDVDEELRRVLPVVRGLAGAGIKVSIDTRRATVMRQAIDAGATVANDVSALRDDPEAAAILSAAGTPLILMHRRGSASEAYAGTGYVDVVREVRAFLLQRADFAIKSGIHRAAIAIDPGIGFGKSVEENLRLVLGLPELAATGFPVLIGLSRKSFIGRITGSEDPMDRLPASLAAAVEAARRGAAILRVHDVAATRQALQLAHAFNMLDTGSPFPAPSGTLT